MWWFLASSTISVLFSEPKIPQYNGRDRSNQWVEISVLFSEPKIPQSITKTYIQLSAADFSALQRAENSSMDMSAEQEDFCEAFQCSSASRKFLNRRSPIYGLEIVQFQCSSASRKFLNCNFVKHYSTDKEFQCSSASRKFLNFTLLDAGNGIALDFSALQRAENSSILRSTNLWGAMNEDFSALQRAENSSIALSDPRTVPA